MTYRYEPHVLADKPRAGHAVCRRCGLLYLTNDLTDWHIRMGCDAEEHPDYQRVRVDLVRRWQQRRHA